MNRKKFYTFPELFVKGWVLCAALLGMGYALGLYGFFYLILEGFRVFSFELRMWQAPIVFSAAEHFWMKYFLAFMSASFGFLIALRFALENSTSWRPTHLKRQKRSLLNTQGFVFWTYLYLTGRVLFILGVLYLGLSLYAYLDFFRSYGGMVILALVFFFTIWPPIIRLAGNTAYKWMGWSLLAVALYALILTRMSFFNAEGYDRSWIMQDIYSNYRIQVPRVSSGDRDPSVVYGKPTLFITTDENDSLLVFKTAMGRYNYTPVHLDSLVEQSFKNFYEDPYRPHTTAHLVIDKDVPMRQVYALMYKVRQAGARIRQSTARIDENVLTEAFSNFSYGTDVPQPLYRERFVCFLDSAEQIDREGVMLKLPVFSPLYRTEEFKTRNHISVYVDKNGITINGQEADQASLRSVVRHLVSRYPRTYAIAYTADPDLSYGTYMHVKDAMRQEVLALRVKAKDQIDSYDENRRKGYRMGEHYVIDDIIPLTIYEWTTEEKRLMALKKRLPVKWVRDSELVK